MKIDTTKTVKGYNLYELKEEPIKEFPSVCRVAATEGAVLLKNEGILPFGKDVKSVAVIGPNANTGEIHGSWHCGGKA